MVSVRLTVVPLGDVLVPLTVMLGDGIALVAEFRDDGVVDFTVSVPVDDPDDENLTAVRYEVAQVLEFIASMLRDGQEEEW